MSLSYEDKRKCEIVNKQIKARRVCDSLEMLL